MEALLTMLVLFALSALSQWIMKKREAGTESEEEARRDTMWEQSEPESKEHAPPVIGPQPPNWQEQLRRLLEPDREIEPDRPRPPQPRPPPPLAPPARSTAPAPLDSKMSGASPREVAEKAAEKFRAAQRALQQGAKAATKISVDLDTSSKAEALRKRVAEHARRLAPRSAVGKALEVTRIKSARSPQDRPARDLGIARQLRSRTGAAQAFAAAVVLAPPKGIEEEKMF